MTADLEFIYLDPVLASRLDTEPDLLVGKSLLVTEINPSIYLGHHMSTKRKKKRKNKATITVTCLLLLLFLLLLLLLLLQRCPQLMTFRLT